MPGQQNYVDDDTFRGIVMPYSAMVADMADAGYTEAPRGVWDVRNPAVDSRAMAELAQQADFAGAWDKVPVDTALTHVGLLLTAGEDAMRTFASALVADRTPLYAYIPLGRSALECLGVAHWLGEPGIGTKERVRRSLNERIASAWEQSRLPPSMNTEPGRQQRLLGAVEKGYEFTKSRKGKFKHFAPERPTMTAHVKRVLGNGDLGKVLYSFASAVAHGVLWGLTERVEVPTDAPGPVVKGALTHSSASVAMMASALVLAHKRAFGGFADYMGWDVTEWSAAAARADTIIKAFLGARREARTAAEERAPEWRLSGPGGGLWLPEPSSAAPVGLPPLDRTTLSEDIGE